MDILYLLVPLSVFAMLGLLGVFAWALHGGQFDDLEAVGAHILDSSDTPLAQPLSGVAIDGDQGPPVHALEESVHREVQSDRSIA
jgi:cbb3-type cytochrome oxidase maturation protein